MRLAALLAVCALLAACSQSVGGRAESSQVGAPAAPSVPTSPSAPAVPSASAATPPVPPARAAVPGPSASIDDVIGFVEAATPVDPALFHVAFRDGVSTRIGDDVAFVAPSGAPLNSTQCVTAGGSLLCLVDLTSPAPRPAEAAEGVWKPGWTEFSGTDLLVGAARGDPGPFVNGTGAELGAGQSLQSGDMRCRSDDSGLFCVNYAHRTAALIAADGVRPYGCLTEVAPPPGSGTQFSC